MRFLLTAGFDRALHAVALAELVTRDGHEIAGVLVVSPFRIARVREWVRRRGRAALVRAAKRLTGLAQANGGDRAVLELLARERIEFRSLATWSRSRRVAYHAVADLNGKRATSIVRVARADAVLYAGGGILRAAFLDAASAPVLNAHSGPLPHVRGMNACEWSLLLGHPPAVTIHLIDRGIDTGAVLAELPLPLRAGDTIDDLRGRCAELGVTGLRRAVGAIAAPLPARARDAEASRQCFTLAPVMRELLDGALARRRA